MCRQIIVDPQRGIGAGRPPQPTPADIAAMVDAVVHRRDLLTVPERRLGLTDSNFHEVRGTSTNQEPVAGQPALQQTHRVSRMS